MGSPSYGIDVVALAVAIILGGRPSVSSYSARAAACGPDDDAAALERDNLGKTTSERTMRGKTNCT